jgi:pSer/pThr/pTyr-binding forkhead associated (FHA) protein
MSNTVVIEDSFASTEHARLSQRTGRWWLEDLGSTNGTRLNGEPLTAPAIVTTGDEIGIGHVRLRIELENL